MNDQTTGLNRQVREVMRAQFGSTLDETPDSTPLPEALGDRYDSLAVMECVTNVSEAFDIEIDFVQHDVRFFFGSIERITEFVGDRLEDRAIIGGSR
jgi:acyl carrier protein